MSMQLWDHQVACIEKAKGLQSLALFMEVGTGKTRTTIEILRHRYNQAQKILPTLIFCPPVVVRNWRKEIEKYSKIPLEKVILLQGHSKKRLEDLKEAIEKYEGKFIAVTNYEAVQSKDLLSALRAWAPAVLVCDESHRLKNHTAFRTKQVVGLSDTAVFRYILTGTPVLNSPMDLFSQFLVLDSGRTFGRGFFAFRHQYFFDKNASMPKQKYFPDWRPKADCEARMGKAIDALSFQAKKSECLTLPPVVRNIVEVELGKEQRIAYDEMLRHYVTFIRENAVVAELAITRTLRMQQILSGFVQPEESGPIPFESCPRLEVLSELLEDITPSGKVIVWCNFAPNYSAVGRACKALGLKHVFITGQQSSKEKNESEDAFQNDPEVKVLIGHPEAGGEGVNLTAASHMIYFTRSYSRKQDVQSEGRNLRGGSEIHAKITRWDLVATGTLDEVVLQALAGKASVSEAILSFARSRK